jgi:hypothetical protein
MFSSAPSGSSPPASSPAGANFPQAELPPPPPPGAYGFFTRTASCASSVARSTQSSDPPPPLHVRPPSGSADAGLGLAPTRGATRCPCSPSLARADTPPVARSLLLPPIDRVVRNRSTQDTPGFRCRFLSAASTRSRVSVLGSDDGPRVQGSMQPNGSRPKKPKSRTVVH